MLKNIPRFIFGSVGQSTNVTSPKTPRAVYVLDAELRKNPPDKKPRGLLRYLIGLVRDRACESLELFGIAADHSGVGLQTIERSVVEQAQF